MQDVNDGLEKRVNNWMINMLKTRVITGVVLVLVFLVAVFFFSDINFLFFLGLIAVTCAWEWAGISGIKNALFKFGYAVFFAVLLLLVHFANIDEQFFKGIVLLAVLWWLIVGLMLYLNPVATRSRNECSPFYLLAGPVTVVPALLSAEYLRIASPWLLLYALSIVWAMDIGAYFSGKRWGKRKLAPLISPGKTIEGVVGGLILTLILCLVILVVRSGNDPESMTLLWATAFAGSLSVAGDLFESRAKRMSGLKDSGHLLPGHGGALDRLDSAFVALPLFTFTLLWL